MEYSEKIQEHFRNPRNVGEIADADGVGMIDESECGDVVKVWLKIGSDEHIADLKYKVMGCPAAIAVCSVMSEMAIGRSIDEAYEMITAELIDSALGGLPGQKNHCSNLAAEALHKAIMDYVFTSVKAEARKPR